MQHWMRYRYLLQLICFLLQVNTGQHRCKTQQITYFSWLEAMASIIQRCKMKQNCSFVATVPSTHAGALSGLWCHRHLQTITVWAWPSPPPSWGSGPPATKERAVAYTRRPSCCEPRLYSASRKGIGLWWHHQSFFTGQGQGQRSSSTFFDISRPKSGFEAIKYIFDMVSSEPHSLSTSTTCYIHTLDVRLWHNGVSSICQF